MPYRYRIIVPAPKKHSTKARKSEEREKQEPSSVEAKEAGRQSSGSGKEKEISGSPLLVTGRTETRSCGSCCCHKLRTTSQSYHSQGRRISEIERSIYFRFYGEQPVCLTVEG